MLVIKAGFIQCNLSSHFLFLWFIFILFYFILFYFPSSFCSLQSGSHWHSDGVAHGTQVVRGGILGGPRWMVDLVDKMFFRTMNITLEAGKEKK